MNKIISSTGTVSFPVILIRFTDVPASQYDNLTIEQHIFGSHPQTATGPGSVYDYYNEISNGELNITGKVYGWYNSSHDTEYYNNTTANENAYIDLIREAVDLADDDIDFSQYDSNGDGYVDNLMVIMCGKAINCSGGCTSCQDGYIETADDYNGLFPHMRIWSFTAFEEIERDPAANNTLLQCGGYAHEIAHVFSLPDMYDHDTNDGFNGGEDNWDLMTLGCFNKLQTRGDSPAHLSAWEKACLGYTTVNQITGGQQLHIDIAPIESSMVAYQLLDNPNGFEGRNMGGIYGTGEYFLIENRQKIGFDQALPGEGLLIWHVNEYNTATGNDDYFNRLLDLEEADGHIHSGDSTDPWYAPLQTTFNLNSTPNSNLNNGTQSRVSITDISEVPVDSYDSMSATFGLPLSGYSSVKAHDIPGSEDGDLTDYQVQFVVNRGIGIDTDRYIYLNGGSQNWPYDFRFTNAAGNKLSYWIESNDTESAIVWVKVDNIAESPVTTQLNINYGKSGDSGESNGSATFILFDDFLGSSINSTLWNVQSPVSTSVSNGILTINWPSAEKNVRTNPEYSSLSPNVSFECNASVSSGVWKRLGLQQGGNGGNGQSFVVDQYSNWNSETSLIEPDRQFVSLGANYANAYHRFRLDRFTDKVDFFVDGVQKTTNTQKIYAGSDEGIVWYSASSGTFKVDWCFVRKVTPHEPIQAMRMSDARIATDSVLMDPIGGQSNNTSIVGNITMAYTGP